VKFPGVVRSQFALHPQQHLAPETLPAQAPAPPQRFECLKIGLLLPPAKVLRMRGLAVLQEQLEPTTEPAESAEETLVRRFRWSHWLEVVTRLVRACLKANWLTTGELARYEYAALTAEYPAAEG
jgi:hypothetical protein